MDTKASKYYSIEEYLKQELVAEDKHEYSHGRVVAMSGGSLNHGIIGSNLNLGDNFALPPLYREQHELNRSFDP